MLHRLVTSLLLAVAVVAMVSITPAPAAGQGQPVLAVEDILPGSCDPSPILVGQYSDCRFPLAREVILDPDGGPYLADVEGSYDEENGDRPHCVIEGAELVCRSVPSYYPAGSNGVRVQVGWLGTTGVLAQITTLAYWEVPAVITPVGSTEPFATAHRPLEIWVDKWEEPGLLAKIRDRLTGEVVAVLPVPDFDGSYDPVYLDVSSLAPGRYEVQPCLSLGDDPLGCEEVVGVGYFQVGSGEVVEAIPGWNRPGADRINLVLAGTGFAGFDAFAEMATALLGFDGPILLDYDGAVVDGAAEVGSVEFGPFATEPIRSNRQRFNIWLLTDLLGDSHALFWTNPPNGLGMAPDGGLLADTQITAIELLPIGEWSGSEAGFPSFTGLEPRPPDRSDLQFAGAYVAVPRWHPLNEADTLTHELGHAVFDLRDEYTLYDRSTEWGYPNCAPDRETAEAWWGDLEGEVDPWLAEYTAVMESYDLLYVDTEVLRDTIAVGYYPGGCYGEVGSAEAVRPTSESVMNGLTPVFGAVNRRRVEEIMDLWTGRDVFRSAADLEVECARSGADPWSITCQGSIVPYVDPPEVGLVMAIDATTEACTAIAGPGRDPTVVRCGPVVARGYDSIEVSVGDPATELATLTLPRVEIALPSVAPGLGGIPPVRSVVPAAVSLWVVLAIVASGGAVFVGGLIVMWRRSRVAVT